MNKARIAFCLFGFALTISCVAQETPGVHTTDSSLVPKSVVVQMDSSLVPKSITVPVNPDYIPKSIIVPMNVQPEEEKPKRKDK
jgi:hypothetical protein